MSIRNEKKLFFHDFRRYTVEKYPNLAWLGPATMAVYWYKTYLNDMGWIRSSCEINKNINNKKNKNKKKRKTGVYFYHIPGQYLTKGIEISDILENGESGIHYADSYIGLYNMIRRYGKFERTMGSSSNSSSEIIKLVDYEGPELK